MLSYVPNHFPILYDSVSKVGTDPVTVFAPVPRFWNALYTTLDRSEALILRRFRGGMGGVDIGSKNGQHPGTVILPFSGTVTLPRNIVLLENGGFGKMSKA